MTTCSQMSCVSQMLFLKDGVSDNLQPNVLCFTDVVFKGWSQWQLAAKCPVFHRCFLGMDPELLEAGDVLPESSILSPLLRYVTCTTNWLNQRCLYFMCAVLPSIHSIDFIWRQIDWTKDICTSCVQLYLPFIPQISYEDRLIELMMSVFLVCSSTFHSLHRFHTKTDWLNQRHLYFMCAVYLPFIP